MRPRNLWLPLFETCFVGISITEWDLLRQETPQYRIDDKLRHLNTYMEAMMQKNGKVKVAGKAPVEQSFTTFVNVTLPTEVEPDIANHFPDDERVYLSLVALLETGYRVGFSYDWQRGAFICSLTCRNSESVNDGKTLTSFAGDWFTALTVSLYKHYVFLEADWTKGSDSSKRPSFG